MNGYERTSQIKSEPGILKQMAVALRREATPAERRVWEMLRGRRLLGLKFRRQHVLHGYIVDFYCHERGLCLELDGAPHLKEEQRLKDAARDANLVSRGYRVVRLMNEAMFRDPAHLQALLLQACGQEVPR